MTALGTGNETEVRLFPITVKLSNPQINSLGPNPDDILKEGEGFKLSLDVTFGDIGALAVVALGVPVRVCWFAESYGPGPEVTLGCTLINTIAGKLSYTIDLDVPVNPLKSEFVYKLAASMRVGAASPSPSIANGFIEAGAVEIYAS
ncbi:MAG: hypothetical protein WCA35_02010 [Kovacikia sp.]